MVKSKKSPQKNIYFLSSLCALMFLGSGCFLQNSEEVKHTKSLIETLKGNQKNLTVDIAIFEGRKDHIEETLRLFKSHYKQDISPELGNNLSRYKALYKIYRKRIEQYHSNVKEQKEVTTQLENLLKDTKNRKLNKVDFKKYFAQEKNDVEKLIVSSQEVAQALYEVEPEYQRLSKYLDPYLVKLNP